MNVALITGASRGLGFALADALARRGYKLVITARGEGALQAAAEKLAVHTEVRAVAGDVASGAHRRRLIAAVRSFGRLDLLANNASSLGLAELADYPAHELMAVYQVNLFAPISLTQAALPLLRESNGRVINISSDAASGPYPTWGVYGSSKAALDQFSNVLGAEEENLRVYAVDPGEMQTAMLREAFPDDDLADRSDPADVALALLELIDGDYASGRYTAAQLAEKAVQP